MRLIGLHHEHFTRASKQSRIVGILWMVPLYAVESFLSLALGTKLGIYLDLFRDCYEGYVLYLFLSLMISYIKDDDFDTKAGEDRLVEAVEKNKSTKYHLFPFSILLRGEVPSGKRFLQFCKFGTLQYSIMRPTLTLTAIILELFGLYGKNIWSVHYGYIYVLAIQNCSVCFAFYCLMLFYVNMKKALEPYHPLGKFCCIKAVVFLSFWQEATFSFLQHFGFIQGLTSEQTRQLKDTLVCFEMMLMALAHTHTFTWKPYVGLGTRQRSFLLEDHFANYSAMRDLREVAPQFLPEKLSRSFTEDEREKQRRYAKSVGSDESLCIEMKAFTPISAPGHLKRKSSLFDPYEFEEY